MMSGIEAFLGKKYKLQMSENFEDYLKFIDISYISRKTAMALSPVAYLERHPDGNYCLTLSTPIRNMVITFRIGEEFDETRVDGAKVRSLITVEGNKLMQTQIENNGRKSFHVREFTPDKLIVTTTADGWNGRCVRTYALVK